MSWKSATYNSTPTTRQSFQIQITSCKLRLIILMLQMQAYYSSVLRYLRGTLLNIPSRWLCQRTKAPKPTLIVHLIFKEGTKVVPLWWCSSNSHKTPITNSKRDVTQTHSLPKLGRERIKLLFYNSQADPTTQAESTQTIPGLSHADSSNNKDSF